MKPITAFILAPVLAIVMLATEIDAQAQSTALVLGGLGAAAGSLVNGNPGTKMAAAAGGAIVGGLIGQALTNNRSRRDLEAYELGRFQEAYIQAYSNWYAATLDPKTGRPPAFDGYWAMDIGMPNQNTIIPQTRQVPMLRQAYENIVTTQQQIIQAQTAPKTAQAADTAVTTSRRKIINGVVYSAQPVIYPRLPETRTTR